MKQSMEDFIKSTKRILDNTDRKDSHKEIDTIGENYAKNNTKKSYIYVDGKFKRK